MTTDKFREKDIPYETLEKFGITREMIDDLPQKVMMDFLSSRQTPVIPIKIEDNEGKCVETKARMILKRNSDGDAEVYFIPIIENSSLDKYTEEEQEQLKKGKAILVRNSKETDNGDQCFVQYDKQTKQVMTVPTPIIARNIRQLSETFQLDVDEMKQLEDGKILTIQTKDNEDVSFGVDLLSKTGIRISDGGQREWVENGTELSKYNFGLYGCWIKDEKDGMKYVSEEDYTEDIQREERLAAAKNVASEKIRGIRI